MLVPPIIFMIIRKCVDKIFGTELFVIVHVECSFLSYSITGYLNLIVTLVFC